MPYSLLSLENIEELKTRRGTSENSTLATILGLTYPDTEGYSIYAWIDSATDACDDINIVCPNVGDTGRWYKVPNDQILPVNPDWMANSGLAKILNRPNLATVATTGSYGDLINTPTIPANQVNSDWNASSGVAQILNKPVLAVVATSGSYTDLSNVPSFATVALTGNYDDLTNKPTIPSGQINSDWNASSGVAAILNKPDLSIYYLNSNPSGYIASISSSDVISALGYTPYNNTNPAGYITGITSGMVLAALGYTPLASTRNITINGLTQDLSVDRTWTLTTTSIAEGTNLYYTASRFNTAFATKTTSDLVEGTNLYYTQARFDSAFGAKSTTNLSEGTNLYYTAARWNTAFAGATTSGLAEGTNLYFTNARARAAISLTTTGTGVATYNNSTGVLNIPTPVSTISGAVTRTLNTPFTVSTTQVARVYYTVNLSTAATALVASGATCFLEYSTNGGGSYIPLTSVSQNFALGLVITSNGNQTVSGEIPANALVRLRTTTLNGTVTYISGQEVLAS